MVGQRKLQLAADMAEMVLLALEARQVVMADLVAVVAEIQRQT